MLSAKSLGEVSLTGSMRDPQEIGWNNFVDQSFFSENKQDIIESLFGRSNLDQSAFRAIAALIEDST